MENNKNNKRKKRIVVTASVIGLSLASILSIKEKIEKRYQAELLDNSKEIIRLVDEGDFTYKDSEPTYKDKSTKDFYVPEPVPQREDYYDEPTVVLEEKPTTDDFYHDNYYYDDIHTRPIDDPDFYDYDYDYEDEYKTNDNIEIPESTNDSRKKKVYKNRIK